jgi:hypothetical protein
MPSDSHSASLTSSAEAISGSDKPRQYVRVPFIWPHLRPPSRPSSDRSLIGVNAHGQTGNNETGEDERHLQAEVPQEHPPIKAPAHMASIESSRHPCRRASPPAHLESAARPVTVNVSTVVVRSRTASLRTRAFRRPADLATNLAARSLALIRPPRRPTSYASV